MIELKPLNSTDLDFIYNLLNDPLVYSQGILGFSYPESDLKIKSKLERWISSNKEKHFLVFDNDEKVGLAQIYNISNTSRNCNLGILLKPNKFNKGIGSKTIEFLIDICFTKMNLHKIEVSIAQKNIGSIKLVEKNGFLKEGVLKESIYKNGKYEDVHLYGLINKKINKYEEK